MFREAQPSSQILLKHQPQIERLYHLCSLDESRFIQLYLAPISIFSVLVQEIPASEYHHHSGVGGLVLHTLDVMENAMKLREGVVCLQYGEERSNELAEVFTYCVAMGALLHDIGKLSCDFDWVYIDGDQNIVSFDPLTSPFLTRGTMFAARFSTEKHHNLHMSYNIAYYNRVLPTCGKEWLNSYQKMRHLLFQAVAGRMELAGEVGKVLLQADRESARLDTAKPEHEHIVSVPHSRNRLGSTFITKFRELIDNDKLTYNKPGAMLWVDDAWIYAVSGTLITCIREHLKFDGVDIPTQLPTLFSLLMAEDVIYPNAQGEAIHQLTILDLSRGKNWEHTLTMLKFSRTQLDPRQKLPVFNGELTLPSDDTEKRGVKNGGNTEGRGWVAQDIDRTSTPGKSVNPTIPERRSKDGLDPHIKASEGIVSSESLKQKILSKNKPSRKMGGNDLIQKTIDRVNLSKKRDSKCTYNSFFVWLSEGLLEKKWVFNRPNSVFHIDGDGHLLCLSPKVFSDYMGGDIKGIQNQVMKARVLHRNSVGHSLVKVSFTGERQTSFATAIVFTAKETGRIFKGNVPLRNSAVAIAEIIQAPKG
ncbi:TraI domain-containing protein [uncultured Shewanella sp.]|uniref:TraI domain-containing protein n=1 Tax=uncultured Shewanella sp. TaxID=173975 RepID=UPI00260B6E0A|nr:TraI domain-containing protein [uncultured Shewanella sp.]